MARSEASPQRRLLNEEATERPRGIVKEVVGRVVAVLVLASVGVALAAYYPSWPPPKKGTSQFKESESRVHAIVRRLKQIMNTNQDPCKDFYAFVCGNYKSRFGGMLDTIDNEMYEEMDNTIEDYFYKFSRTQTAAEKAGSLYLACTSRRINQEWALQEFLREVDLRPSSYGSGKILDKVLFLFFRYNINTLLGLYLEESLLYNGQRELTVGFDQNQLEWFKTRHTPIGAVFYLNTFGFPEEEILLAEYEAAGRLTENAISGFRNFSFDKVIGLESLTPTINQTGGRWTTLVEAHSGSLYRREYPVVVSRAAMEYFDKLYADLGNKKLCLLTAWALLRKLMPLTCTKLATYFSKATIQLWCRDAVFDAMEVPLLSWYLFSAVPPEALRQARRIATQIQFSIMKEIEGSRWIDNDTRRGALDKISAVSMHVGYPKNFDSHKAIDEVYAHYPGTNDTFLFPWLTAMKMTMSTLMQNATTFRFSVTSANAFYSVHRNSVRLLAPILSDPLFSRSAPDAFNYGALGGIVGHEIMHAFDKASIYYNAEGRYGHWWTAHSRAGYDSRLQCMRKIHGITDASIDSEMLSDIAGLVAAHDAYTRLSPTKRHESFLGLRYKDEQLFFISFCLKVCDAHPNAVARGYASRRERCEVPLRMLGAFGQAFRCPAGSHMWIYNESRRCTFW